MTATEKQVDLWVKANRQWRRDTNMLYAVAQLARAPLDSDEREFWLAVTKRYEQ